MQDAPDVPTPAPVRRDPLARATALLAAHPVVDGLNGLPWALRVQTGHDLAPGHRFDLDYGEPRVQTDIPRLRAGGVGGQFWSVQVPDDLCGSRAVSATLEQIDFVRALVRAYPEALRLALGADDFAEARNRDRIASLLGPAGGHAIDSSLGTLRSLYRLGLRSLTLTQRHHTPWADAAADPPRAGGLTAFGEEVVREMNRLGMLVDLSYASADTMRHTLAVTRSPVIIGSTGARALTDHPCNVPDDVLERLPGNGGVCTITFASERITRGPGLARVQDIADHLDHVRNVAGPGHVALAAGYDTDLGPDVPFPDVSGYPHLIAELVRRDWSFKDLSWLTWGNALRVLHGTEFISRYIRYRRAPSTATIDRLDGARFT
ncbi:dipeptidase [Streptomyces sp. MST-110588]|nr:dipeptidase [Streptomyces sp. MST-110588]UNO44112.1 dipeptidase [Streptomyces sp. MST-110588]